MDLYTAAYRLGTYQAIAEMMQDYVKSLAGATTDYEREYAVDRLLSLSEQLDSAKLRFESEKESG